MVKFIVFVCFCLLSSSSFSASKMIPGMWKVSMKIKFDGQTIEPGEVIKENMKDLSPEERELMMAELQEYAGMDENGQIKVCYTPADFDQQEHSISQMGEDCLSRVIKSTGSKVISNFACMDGSSGVNTWFINNARSYTGVTQVVSPFGETSEIIYEGRFHSPRCEGLDEVVI